MKQVIVAEDERAARISLTALLEAEGFEVTAVENGAAALSLILTREPEAALLDIRMPGLNGLEVLKRARQGGSDTALIVMTAHGDSSTAIEAMKLGAFDYVAKPIEFDSLLAQLRRAIEHRKLARSAAAGLDQNQQASETPAMVGHSPAMQHVYKLIGQIAASEATVLVRGESGTGKELVVNAIHHNSTRANGPLIKVNCASIPEPLLESELFGHERARSPMLCIDAWDDLKRPTTGHSSWTKLASSHLRCKPSFCERFRSARWNGWAATRLSK